MAEIARRASRESTRRRKGMLLVHTARRVLTLLSTPALIAPPVTRESIFHRLDKLQRALV